MSPVDVNSPPWVLYAGAGVCTRPSSGKAFPFTIKVKRIGWRQFEAPLFAFRLKDMSLQLMVGRQKICFPMFTNPFGNSLAQEGDKQ